MTTLPSSPPRNKEEVEAATALITAGRKEETVATATNTTTPGIKRISELSSASLYEAAHASLSSLPSEMEEDQEEEDNQQQQAGDVVVDASSWTATSMGVAKPSAPPKKRPKKGEHLLLPTNTDVVLGESRQSFFHPANVEFRRLVADACRAIVARPSVGGDNNITLVQEMAICIVQSLGRFFVFDNDGDGGGGCWKVLDREEAIQRTKQALLQAMDAIQAEQLAASRHHGVQGLWQVPAASPHPSMMNNVTLPRPVLPLPKPSASNDTKQGLENTARAVTERTKATSEEATKVDDDDDDKNTVVKSNKRPSSSSSSGRIPPGTVGYEDYKDSDILCGRGGGLTRHVGNERYRKLIDDYRQEYFDAAKRDKPAVSRKVVRLIRSQGGRFLKQDPNDGLWYEVGDTVAFEKTSQQIRDKDQLNLMLQRNQDNAKKEDAQHDRSLASVAAARPRVDAPTAIPTRSMQRMTPTSLPPTPTALFVLRQHRHQQMMHHRMILQQQQRVAIQQQQQAILVRRQQFLRIAAAQQAALQQQQRQQTFANPWGKRKE